MICYHCGWSGTKSQTKRGDGYEDCPQCNKIVEEINYNKSVDPLIYGNFTKEFKREDWLKLALAALDQADVSFKKGNVHNIMLTIIEQTELSPEWEVK